MKNKFVLNTACILTITTLLFVGCSNGSKTATDTNVGTNNSNFSTINKDSKNINDNDLMNSSTSDSSVQLDSVDDPSQQLSSDELDTLLNDNSALNNIPTTFTAK